MAEAAHAGLSAKQPLDTALAEYERFRNAATLPDYQENLQMAQFGPVPPDVLRLRRAVRDCPSEVTRYTLARYGRIPREDFFSKRNQQQPEPPT